MSSQEEQGQEEEIWIPRPSDFYAHTSSKRRTLTENDLLRNAGVDRLFNSLIPGLPIDTDPTEIRTQAEQICHPLEKILKKLKINCSPWIDELTAAWPMILPAEIAKYTSPGKWDQGILYIYVSSSLRLFEIRRMYLKKIEQTIRGFAQERVTIRQIRLMVNSVPPMIHR